VLAYVSYGGMGFFVERYFYEENRLVRVEAVWKDRRDGCFVEQFHYRNDRLIRIDATDPSGKKYLVYQEQSSEGSC